MSAPGPSTSVVSRPGPATRTSTRTLRHKQIFDYFVGGTDVSKSETDVDNIDVQNEGAEGLDGLYDSDSSVEDNDVIKDGDDEDNEKKRS